MTITKEHVLDACEWAISARDFAQPIGTVTRQYDQSTWDCGTACCIWGAASLLAGHGPATTGPTDYALGDSPEAKIAVRLMRSRVVSPEHVAAALRGECDASGNWRCVDCVDCVDCDRCRDCKNCEDCVDCKNCVDCDRCKRCWDYVGRSAAEPNLLRATGPDDPHD